MIKIEFESKSLDRAIGLLKDINSNLKWNPIPVLNGVRIHTDSKDTIRLYVTNLEVSAEIEVVGKVIEEGEVVVDKRPFIDFLKMNSKISVHLLEGESDQVEIIGDGQRSIRLSNILEDKDDYPSVTPEKEGEVIAKCSAEVLSDMLEKTIFAADKEGGYINGHPFENICLHFLADGNVRAVATDGKILALVTEYNFRLFRNDSDERKTLIPRRSAEIVMRTLKKLKQALVTITLLYPDEKNPENNRILFEINGIRIAFRLADSEYPDYEQIIPPDKDRFEFTANTTELLKALKNISILAPKSRRVALQVEVDKMRISTEGDFGAAQEVVAIKRDSLLRNESDPSAPFAMAFNVDCLTNILNHMEAKTAVISLDGSNAEAGALIKPADSSRYLYLLMPMKLQ